MRVFKYFLASLVLSIGLTSCQPETTYECGEVLYWEVEGNEFAPGGVTYSFTVKYPDVTRKEIVDKESFYSFNAGDMICF